MQCRNGQFRRNNAFVILLAIALVGCESKLSVDLGTQVPADPAIQAVFVELDGVQFRRADGNVQTLEFESPFQVDLMSYLDGNDLRLFTDEQLSDGRYTGVRLLFGDDEDDENRVIVQDGGEYPLALAGVETYSDVDFTVDKDESSSDGVRLALDLRQSLQFDDDDDDGTVLTPVLRAIRLEDAGGVAGNVLVSCPANSVLAIYLFSGEVTPDDLDGTAPDPYLTTGVGVNGSSTTSGYAFAYLPEGTYTLASTCRGDEDIPTTSEDLNFGNVATVAVEAESSVTQNIPD